MKRILSILSITAVIALLLTACGRNAADNDKTLNYADTVGLAQFQSWKMQNERLDPNQYYQNAVQRTTTAPRRTSSRPASSTKTVSNDYGSGSMVSGSENQAKTTEKKGWSKAAKGAAIGGGAGAVAGAVLIKKNRVAGGVVGGVVGAGIGYLIGRSKDKKDGRY